MAVPPVLITESFSKLMLLKLWAWPVMPPWPFVSAIAKQSGYWFGSWTQIAGLGPAIAVYAEYTEVHSGVLEIETVSQWVYYRPLESRSKACWKTTCVCGSLENNMCIFIACFLWSCNGIHCISQIHHHYAYSPLVCDMPHVSDMFMTTTAGTTTVIQMTNFVIFVVS